MQAKYDILRGKEQETQQLSQEIAQMLESYLAPLLVVLDRLLEEQEKRIKYNDLIANAVILNNTLEIGAALKRLMKEGGYTITKETVSMLSPYQTHHIKRFGSYVIDLERMPPPLEEDFSL